MNAMADAKGQSSTLICFSIKVEIIRSFGPPSKAGVIKKPSPIMKTMESPAPTPGKLKGNVT